jgi:hypothetical protein
MLALEPPKWKGKVRSGVVRIEERKGALLAVSDPRTLDPQVVSFGAMSYASKVQSEWRIAGMQEGAGRG